MALTSKTLTIAPQAVYTSVDTNAIVVAYFCNTSQNPVTFSLHAVPSGGTAGAANTIYSNVNITAEDTYVMDTEKIILDDGDSLWATASVDGVISVTICNVEV
jgi:hypothetical protein